MWYSNCWSFHGISFFKSHFGLGSLKQFSSSALAIFIHKKYTIQLNSTTDSLCIQHRTTDQEQLRPECDIEISWRLSITVLKIIYRASIYSLAHSLAPKWHQAASRMKWRCWTECISAYWDYSKSKWEREPFSWFWVVQLLRQIFRSGATNSMRK